MQLLRKNQIKLLCLFCLSLSQVNCVKRQSNIEDFLSGSSKKYWTLIADFPFKESHGIVFNSSHTCFPYYEISNKNLRVLSNMNLEGNKWKVIGDSILLLNNVNRWKIEYINDEVLIINNLQYKELLMYKVSKNQTTSAKGKSDKHSLDL